MDITKAKLAYASQKGGAKRRGIEWRLTFQQWFDWWGADLDKRGRKRNQLQMQRALDNGAYELGNISKGVPRRNMQTKSAVYRRNQTNLAKQELERQRDACVPMHCKDWIEDEDDYELTKMFGVRSSSSIHFVGNR